MEIKQTTREHFERSTKTFYYISALPFIDLDTCFYAWFQRNVSNAEEEPARNLSLLTLILRGIQFVSSAAENWSTS